MTESNNREMNQYLTFMLGNEVFALDIAEVREVLELSEITEIPRMPDFMRGVINLRGHAVPVMDMRMKMNMDRAETTVNTCIIITEIGSDDDKVLIGNMVDSVREVFEMAPDDIMQPPKMGSAVKADFICGMGSQDDEFIIILDFGKILSDDEFKFAKDTVEIQVEEAA